MKWRAVFLMLMAIVTCTMQGTTDSFVSSFINYYEFSADGRYTHEYHPFLLQKASDSLAKLEENLKNNGFNLCGHRIILGYEGEGVPSYYTDFRESKIDDEATSQNRAGWSLRLHNRFGLMTGFLFKDVECVSHGRNDEIPFFVEHINPASIEIFNDFGGIFLQHAFGDALITMFHYKNNVEELLASGDMKMLLDELISFWTVLYSHEVRGSDRRVAATQDILFATEFARYLQQSKVPILSLHVGPDITYPIETFVGQEAAATQNAQDFAKRFSSRHLVPVNGKKTAYVFCSFVDGVGKSTMLGNVKNLRAYGDDIEKYERVDNSSSQYATVHPYRENVFIADLPAQVSHFTYKPDGWGFVPVETEKPKEEMKALHAYVHDNRELLLLLYQELYNEVKDIYDAQGPFAKELCDPDHISYAFLRNIILLQKESENAWVPFTYQEEQFLFNYTDTTSIRILRPLCDAPSSGLKNIESEQMFFFEGIRFPLAYPKFLADFVQQLKEHAIENIVLVDFLSMYPRSSRENVRINYLLQQLVLLHDDFNLQQSLYKHFVSPAELFADLSHQVLGKKICRNFDHEVALRLLLYEMLMAREGKDITGIGIEPLTIYLKEQLHKQGGSDVFASIDLAAGEKYRLEYRRLKQTYGRTKDFINVQQFSFEHAQKFSDALEAIFSQYVVHDGLNDLWRHLGSIVSPPEGSFVGKIDRMLSLQDGPDVFGRYEFYSECRDQVYLTPFLRSIRATWYATIANLLDAVAVGDGHLALETERFRVPPTVLRPGVDGQIFVVQKHLEELTETENLFPSMLFHVLPSHETRWGVYCGEPYCLDWDNNGTNYGIFAFDCMKTKQVSKNKSYKALVTKLVYQYQQKHGDDTVMSTTDLYYQLCALPEWYELQEELFKKEQKNSKERSKHKPALKPDIAALFGGKGKELRLGAYEQRAGAQLCVRLLATLEMIVKDPQADIVVRAGNQSDFKAALRLFEEITLPQYFGIIFEEPLFDDYDSVEPLVSWESFERE